MYVYIYIYLDMYKYCWPFLTWFKRCNNRDRPRCIPCVWNAHLEKPIQKAWRMTWPGSPGGRLSNFLKTSHVFTSRIQFSSQVMKHNYGKSPFSMGKSTISMAIFNSQLLNFQRSSPLFPGFFQELGPETWSKLRFDQVIAASFGNPTRNTYLYINIEIDDMCIYIYV